MNQEFLEKLEIYKTAWSPMLNAFVKIERFHLDVDGEPIITATTKESRNNNRYYLFRATELSQYCL